MVEDGREPSGGKNKGKRRGKKQEKHQDVFENELVGDRVDSRISFGWKETENKEKNTKAFS